MRTAPSTSDWLDLGAALQDAVEVVECPPGLLGRRGIALDRQLVAARADVDAELLLEPGKVLVELAVERAGELVVVEGQDDVRHIGRPGGDVLQFRGGAQPVSPCPDRPLSPQPARRRGLRAATRRFDPDNVTDLADGLINNHRLQPRGAADELARLAPGLVDQQGDLAADQPSCKSRLLFGEQPLQLLQPLVLDRSVNLLGQRAAGVPGPWRIFERKGLRVADFATSARVAAKSAASPRGSRR